MRKAAEFTPAADALAGRIVLVTGTHGGLGAAVAKAAAAAGATVILLGRRVPKLTCLYDAIEAAGGPQPALYPLDLEGATPADYAELAQCIEDEWGRLDGLFHGAAEFPGLTPLELAEPESWLRALHVNLTAPWILTQACLPALRKSPDAAVVFVQEDLSRVAHAYWGGYGVAKQGLAALVAMLDEEWAQGPVRVAAIQPGPMRTALRARAYFAENPRQWPLPEVYAPACIYLLSAAGMAERCTVLNIAHK